MHKYKTYPPTEYCSICKGNCCKRLPGPYHPSDFKETITKEFLTELLRSRKAVVDWWERRDRPGYFLRPPCVNDDGKIFCGSWGGTCSFLKEDGCSLKFEDRPLGCRNLRPGKDGEDGDRCTTNYSKYEAYIAWSRYRSIIEEIRDAKIQASC